MLLEQINSISESLETVLQEVKPLRFHETGTVISVGKGVADVRGLSGVRAQELVIFNEQVQGIAFNLDVDKVGVVLLGPSHLLTAGMPVRRTGRVVDVPVGRELLGRVINPNGEILDESYPLGNLQRMPIERDAPAILNRAAVATPLETGIKVIDTLIPVGHGQRELIMGDRQTGKTSIAVDTMINQRDRNVICIYCAIGQRSSSVARVIDALKQNKVMEQCIVVVAAGEDPPGLQYIAPYAATSIAEYFMEQGRDVLVVYDDLTKHARAYRELSLLLRRPPGREAFPGDIFYIHSRLLERSTQLRA
ncbi:MAG: F0F1 ATP synthase subunit alpha, partial [Gammaproteobacteria bacterium]|nr:F0F1 ATP synthase subunit alpha [Gammaproteobacteria bacterium]